MKVDGHTIGNGKVGKITRKLQAIYKKLTEESGVPIQNYFETWKVFNIFLVFLALYEQLFILSNTTIFGLNFHYPNVLFFKTILLCSWNFKVDENGWYATVINLSVFVFSIENKNVLQFMKVWVWKYNLIQTDFLEPLCRWYVLLSEDDFPLFCFASGKLV